MKIRGKVGLGLVIGKLREEKIKECKLICIMIQCIKVRQLLHMLCTDNNNHIDDLHLAQDSLAND